MDSPGEVKIKNGELEQLAEGQGDSQAYGGHHWGLGCCHFIPHKPHKATISAFDEEDTDDGESEPEEENNSECRSCSDCRGEKVHVCQADQKGSEQLCNLSEVHMQRGNTADSVGEAEKQPPEGLFKELCCCSCHRNVEQDPDERENDPKFEVKDEISFANEAENEYENAEYQEHNEESDHLQSEEDPFEKILRSNYVLQGGIYLGSSLAKSCRAWDCQVDAKSVGRYKPQLFEVSEKFSLRGFSFRLGDVEALREAMPGRGLDLEAGRLYWLTDRC